MAEQRLPIIDSIQHLKTQTLPAHYNQSFQHADFQLIKDFLEQYSGNKATFESYRRELERLLQWTWHIQSISITELTRECLEQFIKFCQHPPVSWVGTKRAPRFIDHGEIRRPNDEWRLFVVHLTKEQRKMGFSPLPEHYQMSQASLSALFASIGSFYNFLVLENIVASNPVKQIKQKSKYFRKQQTHRQVRRLSELQWSYVIDTAESMAIENPAVHERTLFIMSILYLLYLRVSELVTNEQWAPQMGDFYQDSSGNWWFRTVGKGNKQREITVPDDMLVALKRYRKSRQLEPELPIANETTPLIHTLTKQSSITSERQIRKIVQQCFDHAIDKMSEEGFKDEANQLGAATVHWLRHTGISDDINKYQRPIAHVRDDAGHSSSAITDRYNDIELQARHQSAKKKSRN